ncbi:MAG: hypothetical protein EBZ44_07840 [Verrucomicrobia bacterium]|nr:hypothetical protein [Verrucomicrobiota bacterium]
MKQMCALIALGIALGLPLYAQQQEDKTAGGAVKDVPVRKSQATGERTVSGNSSAKKDQEEVGRTVVTPPDEAEARSKIKPEDNSPDVGMFVAMAERGWDVINPASPNKPVYSEVIQEKGTAPTFSNNMMDSPDGSQRMNDGWKLFGWTY